MTAPRAAYDPFAPAGGSAFPDRRLRRSGLDADDVARLRAEWEGMDVGERRELTRFVARNPDSRIRTRFSGVRSRAELEEMTVRELEPLLRQRGLSTDGRKAELVDRLADAYEGGAAPEQPATAPEAPAPTGEAPAAPEDGGDAVRPPEAAPAAAPTPDAAPAPDASPAEDTTTTEETDRG